MEHADLLTRHDINPEHLNQAPAPPARPQALARIQEVPPQPCTVCGTLAVTVRAVVFPGAGSRWVDLCWDHGMAVRRRHRLPQALEGITADAGRGPGGGPARPRAPAVLFFV
ncbi:hypothetical protein ACGF5T_30915 [Streptomyces sp. NPDC047853]|uniref:hypothetical protein n=1 Tax=unclassified Streptomyces TaxID=2593676 RepID=UPI003452A495